MKKTLLSLSIGMITALGVHAQTIFSENFDATTGTALPSGWSMDPVNTTSWKTGTSASLGSQYFPLPDIPGQGRFVALNDDADSSIHNPNTLLITPVINLSGQTGVWASFDLSYLAASNQGSAPMESLTLEASTNGGSSWTVVATMTGNAQNWWEPRYVDLSSVSGQSNVKLAFRYGDDDSWMYGVGIDNFKVFVPAANDLALTSVSPVEGDAAAYVAPGSQVTISGTVFNNGTDAVTSYVVNYQQGSNPVVNVPQTANIPAFGSGTFNNVTYTVPAVGNYPLKVWVTLSGDNEHANDSADAYTAGYSFLPSKKLVFEEATGTWCGWCPRGTVKMKEFAEAHPGVAAQIAVHNGDPMTVAAYDAEIGNHIQGYPSIVVDRDIVGDPGDIQSLYDQYKGRFGFAEVTMGSPTVSGTSVSVPVTIKPAVDINGGKLALVVTEDGVTGTGSGWAQHNYYAGGGQGPMGGYENLPADVVGEIYNFVGRSITPDPNGAASGLPGSMTAGSTYTATLTTTLDASWNVANLKYIVMLFGDNNKILNSDYTGSVGIKNVEAGIDNADIYPNPANDIAYLKLDVKEASKATVTITDIMGRKVLNNINTDLKAGANTVKIATAGLANGMYMVNLNTEKGSITLKLQVLK